MLPIGVVYALITMIFNYFITRVSLFLINKKWILCKRSNEHIAYSGEIARFMVTEFEFCLFLYTVIILI